MNHASLFSGIGGFDLAAKRMGWNNVFQVEIDKRCREVLAKNFPKTKRYEDIKKFKGRIYEGTIDVISGGFPCQPFSVAGHKRGTADDRYLWPEMLRIVRTIKPPFVICENVPGIINMALDQVLSDLEATSYTTETFIIPACAVNAPHRRDRVWVIAYSDNVRRYHGKKENGQPVYHRNRNGEMEEQEWNKQQCRAVQSDKVSKDTNSVRCKREQKQGGFSKATREGGTSKIDRPNDTLASNGKGVENLKARQREEQLWGGSPRDVWEEWTSEPPICGVGDGVPHRMDRIKELGNAIVPQIALEIFKKIEILNYKQ